MQSLAIIDYGSGNLHSATKAFERAAAMSDVETTVTLTSNPSDVLKADRIVLPGVGAFADCFTGLKAVDGMLDALKETVQEKKRPFMGICVGMQLMAEYGLEHGKSEGLGWIAGVVKPIEPSGEDLKIPHMGWNTLNVMHEHPLLSGIETGKDGLHAYFVHSYHFDVTNADNKIAETDHGGPVTAIVAQENCVGTQFHPEKSQKLGLKLIGNFLSWSP